MRTGERIPAKLLEINAKEVKYKRLDNLEGPLYFVTKTDISSVKYQNGLTEKFSLVDQVIQPEVVNSPQLLPGELCAKAKGDSYLNYTGRKSGAGWIAATTILVHPLAGLIPALFCAKATPLDKNLNYKDRELMKDKTYNICYKEAALKTKKRKIWKAFGISSAIWVVGTILLRI